MKSSNIGGQAVLEGIMMRNKDRYAVAVRKPDGDIVVKTEEYSSIVKNKFLLKTPFIRGIFNFIDSLVLGMSTLMYAASFIEDEEDEAESGEKAAGKSVEPTKEEIEKQEKKDKVIMGIVMAFSFVIAILLFTLLPYYLSSFFRRHISSGAAIAAIEGVLRIMIFVVYLWAISKMKDIRRVFMYHGAEHKCINCIEHGMELNTANVQKSSREHKRCGTSFILVVAMISIILFMFIRVDSPVLRVVYRLILIPVIAGIAYEFIKLAGRTENKFITALSKPGLLLQGLTTREPDDDMVEVAIEAVEAVFDWKAYLKENFDAGGEALN